MLCNTKSFFMEPGNKDDMGYPVPATHADV